jgi:hypothetical protein
MNNQVSARRKFLGTLGASGALALFTKRGLFAEALALRPTASTTEGPFYPDKMPLDTDNDLLIINDAITPGVGQVSHLTGRVLTATGQPVRNAFVEIWQDRNLPHRAHPRRHQQEWQARLHVTAPGQRTPRQRARQHRQAARFS